MGFDFTEWFKYQELSSSQEEEILRVRKLFYDIAVELEKLPPSRFRSLAITHLEITQMFAVKSIIFPGEF